MELHDIILRPIITEASMLVMDEKKYTFEVDVRANKTHVKQAIEKVENQVDATVTNAQVKAQTAVQQVTGQAQQPTAKQQTTEQQTTTAKTQTNNPPASSEQASGIITKAQAIAIAQQKANGTVTKVEYESDDNEYEIEIKNGNTEYDFEIDARTGTILSYEEDIDD